MKKLIIILMMLVVVSSVFATNQFQTKEEAREMAREEINLGLENALGNIENSQVRNRLENNIENFKEKLELRLQNMEQIEIKEINEETGEAIVQVKEEVELFGFLKLKVRKEFRLNEDGEVKEKARWFNRFEKSLE